MDLQRRIPLALAVLLAAGSLGACIAPKPPSEGRGPEWISIFGASVDRRGSDEASVDDSGALALEGGYDFLNTRALDAGFELGVVWSRHEVAQVQGANTDPHLDVTRWQLGGRVSLDLAPLNALLYVNGGIYVRDEESKDEPDFEQNGRGSYVGGGVDFWYDPGGRMGPFVRYYDFADSDLTEVLIGLSATFSL